MSHKIAPSAAPQLKRRTPTQRWVAGLLIVAQVISPTLLAGNAWAQAATAAVTPDRTVSGERPVVGVAANGVPIVQIAPPSAAGVSNNRFTQYNVGTDGLILNNSGASSQTQLGGWIGGNPMLGNHSARTILNQVTGNAASVLNGFTEVAGKQANVIVANPNGITCDGCGFINTPRVTLTTGTPVFGADGGIAAFQVTQGQIGVDGKGINTRNLDQLDLLARSVRINAEVWANKLQVVTGTGSIDYISGQVAAQGAAGGVPLFALDVSHLGGMYANSMRLIGTELGLGVNSAGHLQSLIGTLELTQAGDVRITGGSVQAAGDLLLRSNQAVSNAGALHAQGNVALDAMGALQNSGSITATTDVQIQAGSLGNTGSVAAGVDAAGKVGTSGQLVITTSNDLQNSGQLLAGQHLSLSGDKLLLGQGSIAANDQISISARGMLDHHKAQLSGNRVTLNAAQTLDNTEGSILSRAGTTVQAGAVSNRGGTLQAQTGLTVQGDGGVDNTSGKLLAGEALRVTTEGVLNNALGTIAADQSVALRSGGALANQGGVIQGPALDIQAAALHNAGGSVVQTGATDQTIMVTGALDNTGGRVASNANQLNLHTTAISNGQGVLLHAGAGQFDLRASQTLDNSQGAVSSNAALVLATGELRNQAGRIASLGSLGINASSLGNIEGSVLSGGDLSLSADGALNNRGGTIEADRRLTISAASLDNSSAVSGTSNTSSASGRIAATGTEALSLQVSGEVNNTKGFVGGNGALSLSADSVGNTQGTLYAAQDLSLATSAKFDNTQGLVQAGGQVTALVGTVFENRQGSVQGNGVTLQAQTLGNVDGRITQLGAAGSTTLRVTQGLDNHRGSVVGEGLALTLAAGSIDNHAGTVSQSGDGALTIQSSGAVDNAGGRLLSGGTLDLQAQTLNNAQKGLLQSGLANTLALTGELNNDSGSIVSGADLTLGATQVSNQQQGLIQSVGAANLALRGGLNNTQGTLLSGAGLSVDASDDIHNEQGTLQAGEQLSVTAANLDNRGGHLISLGSGAAALVLRQTLDNSQGVIGSNGAATLTTTTLRNSGGSITTHDNLDIATDQFVLKGGLLDAGAKLTLQVKDALDNRGNTLQARDGLTVRASAFNNGVDDSGVAGRVVVTGNGALTLDTTGAIHNAGGFMAGNGGVNLSASAVDNTGGTVYAKQAMVLTTAGMVNNSLGTLQADASFNARVGGAVDNRQGLVQAEQLDLQLGSLNNDRGQLLQLGNADAVVKVTGALSNVQGSLVGNGNTLNLTADSIDNTQGSLSHTGSGQFTLGTSAGLVNAGGTLLAAGTLSLQAQGHLDNTAGTLQAGDRLAVAAKSLDNTTGQMLSLGQGAAVISVQDTLNNTKGLIGGNGSTTITAQIFNNTLGSVLSYDDLNLFTDKFVGKGGTLKAGGTLDLSMGDVFDNRGNTLEASKNLSIRASSIENGADASGASGRLAVIGGGTLKLDATGAINNVGGFIGGNGKVELSAGSIDNTAGTLYAQQDLALTTVGVLNNRQGTIQADGQLTASTGGTLDNRQGVLQADGLNLQLGGLNNQRGELLQLGSGNSRIQVTGLLDNSLGKIASKAEHLDLSAGSLDNSEGKLIHSGAGSLTVSSSGALVNLGGQILATNELALQAQSLTNGLQAGQAGLIQSGGAATLSTTGALDNADGTVVSAGTLTVSALGDFDNRNGTLEAARTLSVHGQNIDNRLGRIVSLGIGDSLSVQASNTLNNQFGNIGTNGALTLGAATLANTDGQISAVGNVALVAGVLDNERGKLTAGGSLDARLSGALINASGSIQAGQLSVTALSVDNTSGKVLATGSGPLALGSVGAINNTLGFIGGNGDLSVGASNLDNRSGTVYAKQVMVLSTAGAVNNSLGTLQADGQLNARISGALDNQHGLVQGDSFDLLLGSLDNQRGRLAQLGTVDSVLKVTGALVNTEGSVAGNATQFSLVAGSLDNREGSLMHAGGGQFSLSSSGALRNDGGKILAARHLALDTLSLSNGVQAGQAGLIQSGAAAGGTGGGDLSIHIAGDLDNAKGGIVAGGALSVLSHGAVNNAAGTLQAGDSVALSARNLDNRAGQVLSLGGGTARFEVGETVQNNLGLIASNGSVAVNAGTFDNTQGSVITSQDLTITAETLRHQDGSLQVGGALALAMNHAFDNRGNTLQARTGLSVRATAIDNSANAGGVAGRLLVTDSGTLRLDTLGDLNNRGGFVGSNGNVALSSANLDNTGTGTLYAKQDLSIDARQLDNTQGTVQADGTLGVTVRDELRNGQGLLQAGQLNLSAPSLDNRSGKILALGSGDTTLALTGALHNSGGSLVANGRNLNINAASIDNAEGSLTHAGSGQFSVTTASTLANQGGRILAANQLALNAPSLANGLYAGKAGLIQSGGAASITVSGTLNNADGNIVSASSLTLGASGDVDNTGGNLEAATALTLRAQNLHNSAGRISALDNTGSVNIEASNAVNNEHGNIGSNGAVTVRATSLANSQGTLNAVGGISLATDAFNNEHGLITAGAALDATIGGTLRNRSGTIQADQITASAASVENAAGRVLATGSGVLRLSTLGDIHNATGFIGGNGNVALSSANLDNTGTGTLYAKQDLSIDARQLDNTQGTVQADGTLGVTVRDELRNGQGLLQAGQLNLSAPSLDNRSGKILALGSGDTTLALTGALHNSGGSLVANGRNLNINAASIDNAEGNLTHAGSGQFSVTTASTLANQGGRILAANQLALNAPSLANGLYAGKAGLIQSGGAASITVSGTLNNADGNIVSASSLTLGASGDVDNTGGNLEAATALTLRAQNLHNSAGRISALDSSGSVNIEASNAVNNQHGNIGSNGGVTVSAFGLANSEGQISAVGGMHLVASNFNNEHGQISAGALLTADVAGVLRNAGGSMQGGQVAARASDVDNSVGRMLATGSGAFTLSTPGVIQNTGGFIGGNGDVALNARNIDNTSHGTLFAKQDLNLDARLLDNTQGTLQADGLLGVTVREELRNSQGLLQAGQLNLSAPSLDNRAGKILQLGLGDTSLTFTGALQNSAGSIVANGNHLTISAASIDNTEGTLSHAGSGQFSLASARIHNQGGSILAANDLVLDSPSLANGLQGGKGGLIQSGGSATITSSTELDNTDGSMLSSGTLTLTTPGDITNTRGTLEATTGLTLQSRNVHNQDGRVLSQGASGLIDVQALDTLHNEGGLIGGNGAVALSATSIRNSAGRISALGEIDLLTPALTNIGGAIQSQQRLRIHTGADGNIDNTLDGLLQGGQLDLTSRRLNNTGGSLIQTGSADTLLQGIETLENHNGVLLSLGTNVRLNAQAIQNAGGLIEHRGSGLLSLSTPGAIDNRGGVITSKGNASLESLTLNNTTGGLIEAQGTLQANTGAALDNRGGLLQSVGDLTVTTPEISNAGGELRSDGLLSVTVPELNNVDGVIAGKQLALSSDSVRNTRGHITQTGSGAATIRVAGLIDNQDGEIATNGQLTLEGRGLDNRQGRLIAAEDASMGPPVPGSLTVTMSDFIDNMGGLIASTGVLNLGSTNLINREGGKIEGGNTVTVAVSNILDNEAGKLAAQGDVTVNARWLRNSDGTLASIDGQLGVTTTGLLDNVRGRLESGTALNVRAAELRNAQGRIVGGALDLDTHGSALDNTDGTIAARGTLQLNSGALTNTRGLLQAGGQMTIDTHGGTLNNAGTKDIGVGIVGLGAVTLTTGALDNQRGYIGATGALTVTASGEIDNSSAGLIMGLDTVTLNAPGIKNFGGQIMATKDLTLNLGAGTLDNEAGLVRSGAKLTANAGTVVNVSTLALGDRGLEGADVTLNASHIHNAGGAIRADKVLTLNTPTLDNSGGLVSSTDTVTISNAATRIDNAGGTLIADKTLNLNAGNLSGVGSYLSKGALTFTYEGDYTHIGTMKADGDLHYISRGTLTNNGILGTQANLWVEARDLHNLAGREISADNVTLKVAGTLTNEGLIDSTGITKLDVGRLDNQSRVYGTAMDITAGSVDNAKDAVIASRQDMTLTAGSVTNRENAIIASEGNMTMTGGRLENLSGTVESTKDMTLAMGSVFNYNEFVSADTTTSSEHIREYMPRYQTTVYGEGRAGIRRVDVGLLVTDSNPAYPIALFGVESVMPATTLVGSADIGFTTVRNYSVTDPIWAKFGVWPPSAPPSPPAGGCFPDLPTPDCDSYAIRLAAWEAASAWNYANLDSAIGAFNTDLDTRSHEDWTTFDYTRTTKETVVTLRTGHLGAKAKILVGGNLNLSGGVSSVTNKYGQIFVGGTIAGAADAISNTAAQGKKEQVDLGTAQFTHVESCGFLGGSHCREDDTPTPIDITKPFGTPGEKYGDVQEHIAHSVANKPNVILHPVTGAASGAGGVSGDITKKDDTGSTSVDGGAPVSGAGTTLAGGSGISGSAVDGVTGSGGGGTGLATADVSNNANGSTTSTAGSGAGGRVDATGADVANSVTGDTTSASGSGAGTTIAGALADTSHTVAAGGAGAGILASGHGDVAGSASGTSGDASGTGVGAATGGGTSTTITDPSARAATTLTSSGGASDPADQAGQSGLTASIALDPATRSANNALRSHTDAGGYTSAAVNPAGSVSLSGLPTGTNTNLGQAATNERVALTGADGRTQVIRTSTPNLHVPGNALYQTRTEPGVGYLVETDPRYAQYRQWASSDYMLSQLGSDPAQVTKRLGDGYYEQKLVADQVMQTTGNRFVGNYASNEEQYQALMAAGSAFGKAFHLNIGTALSAEQMDQLTENIVWLVEQDVTLPGVDGKPGSTQKVLVPQVYVRASQGDLKGDGTLISARDIKLNLSGDLVNSGTIATRARNDITAENISNRAAGRILGADVALNARTDLSNLSGSIAAGNSVHLQAGRDLTLATNTLTAQGGSGRVTALDHIGTVSGASVTALAGRDLRILGASLNAKGELILGANRNVTIDAVQTGRSIELAASGHIRSETLTHVGSTLTAGGDLTIGAGQQLAGSSIPAQGDLSIRGSNLNAGGALTAVGSNVTIQSAIDRQSIDILTNDRHGFNRLIEQQATAAGGQLNAVGNLTIVAKGNPGADGKAQAGTGDITIQGARLTSESAAVALAATNSVNIVNLSTLQHSATDSASQHSGLFKSSSSAASSSVSTEQIERSSISGSSVAIDAGQDILVQGSNVIAVDALRINAGRNLSVVSVEQASHAESASQSKHSGLFANYSSGVASVGYNKSSQAAQGSFDSLTQQASGVGSLQGNATLKAGETLLVSASDIAAKESLSLIGKAVDLRAAQDTTETHQSSQSKSSGFAVGVTLEPLSAFKDAYQSSMQNAQSTSAIGKRISQDEAVADGLTAAMATVVIQAGSKQASGAQNESSSTARVSTLTAGKDLNILASDGSITSQGTQISAEGNALILAKNAISFDVAHNTHSQDQTNQASGASTDNRTRLVAGAFNQRGQGAGDTDTITGTQVSVGGTATLATQQGDITLTAANVVSQGALSINAGHNLTIQSGQDTLGNTNQSNNKAIGQVVISDTERFAGYHKQTHQDSNTQVTQVGSNVASLQGDVTLTAGNQYTQSASKVLAGNDISVTAKTLDIASADNTGSASQQNSDLKVGAFARVSSPIIDLINNVEAARQSDGRLQTMQGLAAASNAYQTASAVSSLAGGAGSGSLIKAEVGVGFASSSNSANSSASTAQASSLNAGNNLTLTSTEGNIHASGAALTAGQTLSLNAARDIVLDASQSSYHADGKNKSAGLEVGVGVSVGAQTGVYAYVAAQAGSGHNQADGVTHSNTHLVANSISLTSGGDTTLRGADAKANTITTDVAGKLAIESVQDSSQQSSRQSSVGGRLQVSFGSAWELSGSASQAQGNASSTAVNQQSGLFAGDGGYHIKADSIDLKGGAIASTNAANSDLTTNQLTSSNLDNRMSYQAASASLAGAIGGGSGKGDTSADGSAKPPAQQQTFGERNSGNVTPGLPMQEKGDTSSITYATLSDGKITVAGQTSTSAASLGLNTDASKAHTSLANAPDIKALLSNQQAISNAAGTVIATGKQIAGDLASNAARTQQAAQAVIDNPASSPEQVAQARQTLVEAKQSQTDWGTGGDYNRALNVVTGILVGGVAGQGTGQLAANASAPYAAAAIGDYFKTPGNENQTLQNLSHAVLGATLAYANGSSAVGGALAGGGAELAAQILTKELYPQAFDANGVLQRDKLTPAQVANITALTSGIGALLSGAAGGSLNAAATGGRVASNAVENNYLNASELTERSSKQAACSKGDQNACNRVKVLDALSVSRNSTARDDFSKQTVAQTLATMDDLSITMSGLAEHKAGLEDQLKGTSDPTQRATLQNQINQDDIHIRQIANLGKDGLATLYEKTGDPKYQVALLTMVAATSGNDLAALWGAGGTAGGGKTHKSTSTSAAADVSSSASGQTQSAGSDSANYGNQIPGYKSTTTTLNGEPVVSNQLPNTSSSGVAGGSSGGTVASSTANTPIPEILLPDPPVGSGARPAGSTGIGFDGYTPPASATPNAPGTVRAGNSSLDVHLIDEGGATHGKNIYGTHDMGAFNDALAANGGTVLNKVKEPGTDGIYTVRYELPGKSPTVKTVFDPAVYPPAEMASMAQSAAQSAINQATATGVTGPVTVNVGGLKWSVIVSPGPSGVLNVKTAYPIGAAPWP